MRCADRIFDHRIVLKRSYLTVRGGGRRGPRVTRPLRSRGKEGLDPKSGSATGERHFSPGAVPFPRAVWNEDSDNRSHKNDENFLSSYFKQHLQTELVERSILVEREVELRATKSGDGQRTDILVQAVKKHGSEEPVATVVIEVKGCWNKDLETAMEEQLRDRYLKKNGWCCGVYLVGWFLCDRWRRARVARRAPGPEDTIEAWRDKLAKQAQELCVDGFRLRAFVLDARVGPAT